MGVRSAGRRRASTLVLAAAILIVAPTALAKPPEGPASFATPGVHTWTVPKHGRLATFDVYGAAGGSRGDAAGGLGAHVRATLAVRAGDALTIVVGGRGGQVVGRTPGAGGFNGGAAGGAEAQDFVVTPSATLPGGPGGAGGGGASDVRSAGDLASRLVVAGGGGGAGGVAGGPGGAVGQDGGDGPVTSNFGQFPDVPGGGGGTATAGGAGGSAGAGGILATGGHGADAPPVRIEPGPRLSVFANGQGGGGGGGGLFGGGGGGAGETQTTGLIVIASTASGGGGGSSLAPADSVCPVLVETGVRDGDGLVVVRWTRAKKARRACPTTAPRAGAT
jgi:hypothetical protein